MARLLYGASPADYTVDAVTGAPDPGVNFQVFDAIDGTPVTDLLEADGVTLVQGDAITSVTSNGSGAFPFYGPDGYDENLWFEGVDGWYGISPTALADIVSLISTDTATALAATLDQEGRITALEGVAPGSIDPGDISHSDLADLVLNDLGVTLNPHTQYALLTELPSVYYNKGQVDSALAAKVVPLTTMYQGDAVLATGVGTERLYVDFPCTIVAVRATVTTAPTGATLIVDVNKNGTTIFGTQANRPTIAASGFTDLAGTASVTTLAAGDYLTFDIDQIGSTVAGGKLKVSVTVRP